MQFLQRTDDLAALLGCYLRDLPAKIGISERSMFGYRAGKYPVTAKALRKLEAAERAAGIHQGDPAGEAGIAGSSGKPKDYPAGNGEKVSPEDTLLHDASPEAAMQRLAAVSAAFSSQLAALQITPPFSLQDLEDRMRAANAWPASAEDRKLSPGTLWQKYAPKP